MMEKAGIVPGLFVVLGAQPLWYSDGKIQLITLRSQHEALPVCQFWYG